MIFQLSWLVQLEFPFLMEQNPGHIADWLVGSWAHDILISSFRRTTLTYSPRTHCFIMDKRCTHGGIICTIFMEGSTAKNEWRWGAEYHGWGPYPNPDLLLKSICSCWWNSDFWVYPVYPSLPVISAWCNMASAITFDSSLLSKSGASAPHFCSADVFSKLWCWNLHKKGPRATVVPPSDCTGWKKNGFMVSLEKSSIWIIIPGCFEMDSQASFFNHVWGTAQWLDGDKQPGGEKLAPSGIAHPSCESTRIHQKHYLAPFITLWYCNQTWQSIILLEWGFSGNIIKLNEGFSSQLCLRTPKATYQISLWNHIQCH